MNNYKKEQINIDTVCKYSNDGIFNVLKNYIDYEEKIYDDDGDEVPLYHRLTVVCAFTEYLTNEKLLNHTLDFLKTHDLINDIENTGIDLSLYSENDKTKIKAIYYSLTSLYKLNMKNIKFPNSKKPKQLDIKLKENRVIEHNLQEVLNSIRMNNVYQFEESISKYPINTQKNEINKWIRSALKVGRSKETKMFDEEIDYLKDISDHLIEPKAHQQQVPINEKEPMKVIALLHFYNNKFMTLEEANTIAKKYDYNSKESGRKLFQYFSYYSNRTSRMSTNESKRFLKAKIKIFERVIELLTDETAIAKANTELKLLEIKYTDIN
ncbi:hypothetical protein [Flavobacterium sp. LB2P53]|uniref:hypothetical protein n=1 Tax=Flavobacterium sp. LB2P53 TaxID=2497481 RepID=UPI000F84CC1C|nr:hypothetical protein [Flavobacterium sp. LB2P53]RTY65828.1 hypothetical protein EKL95_12175 [Flavobacterium sp. LB2P53]